MMIWNGMIEGKAIGPGSLSDLLDWAKTRDPDEQYDYCDSGDCALARYARDKGIEYSYGEDGWATTKMENAANVRFNGACHMRDFVKKLEAIE